MRLCIDLFCGLGGWAEGFLAEGYDVVGFDTEWQPYPAQRVIQDVLTLHGSQFSNATVIVASPPCQAYSYRAMPWKRAKTLPPPDNTLFESCFRIQREASEAAGHKIPLIVENVCGAQKWVGRAKWHYGSYYLWGDVPALVPIVTRSNRRQGQKNSGGSWFNVAHNTTSGTGNNPTLKVPGFRFDGSGKSFQSAAVRESGIKQGGEWFHDSKGTLRSYSSKSPARKPASAMIAKIPFPLARYIAWVFKPKEASGGAGVLTTTTALL